MAWLDDLINNNPGILALGSGLIGLGGSLAYQNAISGSASDAANIQNAASQLGINLNLDMMDKAIKYYEPYYQTGLKGLSEYQEAPAGAEPPSYPSATIDFDFNPEDKMYKIRQEEGERAINRSLAARGMYDSRPGINALSDFNRKLIAEETQNQYNRAVDEYNRKYQTASDIFNAENALAKQNLGKWSDVANMGAGAAQNITNALTQTGGNISDLYGKQGTASALAALAQGKSRAGLSQDLASLPFNMLSDYQILKGLGDKTGSTVGTAGTNALTSLGGTGASILGTGIGTGTAGAGLGANALGGATLPGAAATLENISATGAGLGAGTGTGTTGAGLGTNALSGATGAGAAGGGAGATMGSGAALGTIGAGILAAPLLGPTITKGIRSLFGGHKSAPAAGEYLAALTGGPENEWTRNALNQWNTYLANNERGITTQTPAQMISGWIADSVWHPTQYDDNAVRRNPYINDLAQRIADGKVSYNQLPYELAKVKTYASDVWRDPTAH